MMKNYYGWSIFNTYRAFQHRRRALATLPLSLGLNPDGLTYRLAALLAKNPITHCLGDTSGAFSFAVELTAAPW